ncbi:sterol desaturase family protein [Verminephrobacter eiseniae]|uniref:sterol desaturase family protein n=1 Tax=Verminephrobacter eiseniae TaxID=364317 RepID=UPI0022381E64|nr:sterol desaturase family protein [Verminephrobacter eiseniae]MCW5231538.1 fatty acid hydroxylase family protein [Verminephrobacter eiseniae]MCW5293267.1 fatty acid hydroxylase family protein [Verminephrobacter eiseniae]MCW8187828.1 fatty acid hydroxylase family protein [Verminephrobacter eiseniae]MCW8225376.1 fatty acid hydroxylase family protein [Verminephrobacter eiseniae]MCW8235991.1 fatty acid hydroxylase family protein [Verminephrobacter eiseniae]
MQWLGNGFDGVQQWLFETVLQPLMFAMGLASLLENGYEAAGWLLVGLLQLLVIVALIGPLQRLWPVEPLSDRASVRTDILYTLIHRLGLFRLALFFTLDPLVDSLFGALRVAGVSSLQLDGLWPGVTDIPWVSWLLYLVVFDFVDYWIHRGQHQIPWWWCLHSLHHAQRQMTMWSDNRNHLLDDLLRDAILVVVAQLIGVAPGQFIAIVALTQLSESFQHANLRLWFGRWGERLWISPRFHRLHHGIGIGHETIKPIAGGAAQRVLPGGHNFGVLLPWWDMLMGSANFELRYDPTGVRDQIEPGPDGQLRDYGQGFCAQQWRGVLRLLGRA